MAALIDRLIDAHWQVKGNVAKVERLNEHEGNSRRWSAISPRNVGVTWKLQGNLPDYTWV